MVSIKLTPVGTVPTLPGSPLSATITLGGGQRVDWYEIQLAPRSEPDDAAWDRPIWRYRSDMPRIDALDDKVAYEGVLVASTRPKVRIVLNQPVVALRWQLRQDGQIVDRGHIKGIDTHERVVMFKPSVRLRRTDELAKPRPDVLYPPFDSCLPHSRERSPETRVRYKACTGTHHAGGPAVNGFAVDFNCRYGEQDRGHWVLAAARGKVIDVVDNNGEVHIEHPDFGDAFETWYAHMDPVLVKRGDNVDALQRIGKIGSRYWDPAVTISPHLHHQHRRGGTGVHMRLFIKGKTTDIPVSLEAPTSFAEWAERVSGWNRPSGLAKANLIVRAKPRIGGPAGVASGAASHLRFVVAARGAMVNGTSAGSAEAPTDPTSVRYVYNGTEVEPGDYSLRYRVRDDAGLLSDWAYDHSVAVRPDFG